MNRFPNVTTGSLKNEQQHCSIGTETYPGCFLWRVSYNQRRCNPLSLEYSASVRNYHNCMEVVTIICHSPFTLKRKTSKGDGWIGVPPMFLLIRSHKSESYENRVYVLQGHGLPPSSAKTWSEFLENPRLGHPADLHHPTNGKNTIQ